MIKILGFLFFTTSIFCQSKDSAAYYYELAVNSDLNDKSKELHKALYFIDASEQIDLSAQIYLELSILSRRSSNLEKAIEYAYMATMLSQQSDESLLKYKSRSVLASAYYKSSEVDSAIYYYLQSGIYLDDADIHSKAALNNNLGNCFSNQAQYGVAMEYYYKARDVFVMLKDSSSIFSAEINIAETYLNIGQYNKAEKLLDSLNILAETNKWVDHLFHILDLKVDLIAKKSNLSDIRILIDSITSLEHLEMIQQINDSNIKYETQKKENDNKLLKVESEKRKYTILILGLLLFSVLVGFFVYLRNQVLKKKLFLVEKEIIKQTALSQERTRIASEMHDDLGGGLTTIKFLSQKVLRKTTDEPTKVQVKKIVNQSETLVNNMSEIIWAMNSGFDTLSSLISFSRRYAHSFMEDYGIDLKFKVEGKVTNIKLSGTERRNMFLVIKELLHNSVKHSQSTIVNIDFMISDDLVIVIRDNGIGITEEGELGNGLKNMKARMEKIGGNYSHQNESGLRTRLTFPFRTL